MFDDARLARAIAAASETERAVRYHLTLVGDSASEHARGQDAYRHAVALRKSLEAWLETRAFRATQQERHDGQVR
jgi:hypothetical protein